MDWRYISPERIFFCFCQALLTVGNLKINSQYQSFTYCTGSVIGHKTHMRVSLWLWTCFSYWVQPQASHRLVSLLSQGILFCFSKSYFPWLYLSVFQSDGLIFFFCPCPGAWPSQWTVWSQESAYHLCICVFASLSVWFLRISLTLLPPHWYIKNICCYFIQHFYVLFKKKAC